MDTTEIKRILPTNWNMKKKHRFLDMYSVTKLSHDDIENLNGLLIKMDVYSLMKIPPTKKRSRLDVFTA